MAHVHVSVGKVFFFFFQILKATFYLKINVRFGRPERNKELAISVSKGFLLDMPCREED